MKTLRFFIFVCVGILILYSCAEDTAGPSITDGGTSGCTDENAQRWLAHASPIQTNTEPGATIPIAVFVIDKDLGLLTGVPVTFKIMRNPSDAYLTPNAGDPNTALATSTTEGTAGVMLFVGNQPANFQVQATSEGMCSKYFTIVVEEVLKYIEIMGPSNRAAFVRERIPLQVKVINSRGAPLQGEVVEFVIKGSNPGGATLEPTSNFTGPGGDVLVEFFTGEFAHHYTVQAKHTEAGTRDFSINVNQQIEGGPCTTSFDCAPGYYCDNGTCVQNPVGPDGQQGCAELECPEGPSVCVLDIECPQGQFCDSGECRIPQEGACNSKADCPKGYTCRNGECFPDFIGGSGPPCSSNSDCSSGLICIDGDCLPEGSCTNDSQCQEPNICRNGMCAPADSCIFDRDCPDGQFCDGSQCAPIPPEEEPPINVSGRWITYHTFDLRDALGGFPEIAPYIDDINQILHGHICDVIADYTGINIPGWACFIIDAGWGVVVQMYIPSWIPDVTAGLNAVAYMFQEMRVKGEMNLTYTNNCDELDGEEQWISVKLFWIDRCERGRRDPNFPNCAAMDIMLEEEEEFSMEVECDPFQAKTSGHVLTIYEREVRAEVYKLIRYVIELVINIASDGQIEDIEGLVVEIMPCELIDAALDGMVGIDLPFAEFCVEYSDDLGRLIESEIDNIGIDWTVFKFSGYATIVDDGSRPQPCGRLLKDGHWDGTVQVIFDGDLTGTWKASK